MKKILFSIIALCSAMSVNAQTVKLYMGETLVATYASDKVDKVVFEEDAKVNSITLNKTTATLFKGSTTTLIATVLPDGATDKTVTWNTSNASVATVADGVVTAVEVGTANITATANDGSGVSATCEVTVTVDPSDSHEYVDLGLPSGTLWAKTNIGATNIYDYGDYFAWGETSGYNSGKTKYEQDNYKYYGSETTKDAEGFDVTIKGYIKYINKESSSYGLNGFYDDKTTLESGDDAATVNWGGLWRIPTKSEWQELEKNCTWTWVSLNDIPGFKISSTNGKYIFLPAAGWRGGTGLIDRGSYGSYESSSASSGEDRYYTYFGRNGEFLTTSRSDVRYYADSVRPVRSK